MDIHNILDTAFGLILALFMWVLKVLHSDNQATKKNLEEFKDHIPGTYARRDEVDKQFDRVVRILERIEDKVDRHNV